MPGDAGGPRSPGELGPQGLRTRKRLLEAGRTVIARQGVHGTRVDDIAALAGTSHGTFYLYFANTEHLLATLQQECSSALEELTAGVPELVAGDDGRAALREWIGRFDELYLVHGPIISANLDNSRDGDEQRLGVYADLKTRLAEAIESAGCEVAAELAAVAIIAMLDRFSFFSRNGGGGRDHAAALDTLATMSHAGLFG